VDEFCNLRAKVILVDSADDDAVSRTVLWQANRVNNEIGVLGNVSHEGCLSDSGCAASQSPSVCEVDDARVGPDKQAGCVYFVGAAMDIDFASNGEFFRVGRISKAVRAPVPINQGIGGQFRPESVIPEPAYLSSIAAPWKTHHSLENLAARVEVIAKSDVLFGDLCSFCKCQ
jgi:hypothetical protein